MKVDSVIIHLDSLDVKIPIEVTNNSNRDILITKEPQMASKLGMGKADIGMEFFFENTKQKRLFIFSSHRLGDPTFIPVKPHEKQTIVLKISTFFFDRKEIYDVFFYILLSSTKVKERLKNVYVRSNKVKMVIK